MKNLLRRWRASRQSLASQVVTKWNEEKMKVRRFMKLGEKQVLMVVKQVEFGVYLGNDEQRVLLPKKQVPSGVEPGDPVEVFLYKDSSDRLIATTHEPKLTMGKLAVLDVVDVTNVGA